MQKAVITAPVSTEGFLLLDCSLNPIFFNLVATQILIYPQKVETQRKLHDSVAGKIRSTLLSVQSSGVPALTTKFQSGKRLYLCRSFRVNAVAQGDSEPLVAVLLERGSSTSISPAEVSKRFRLTGREQGVFQYLSQGLTSKEIAGRMGISPNTVKAFLRLIMTKMRVSTRSGILGRLSRNSLLLRPLPSCLKNSYATLKRDQYDESCVEGTKR